MKLVKKSKKNSKNIYKNVDKYFYRPSFRQLKWEKRILYICLGLEFLFLLIVAFISKNSFVFGKILWLSNFILIPLICVVDLKTARWVNGVETFFSYKRDKALHDLTKWSYRGHFSNPNVFIDWLDLKPDNKIFLTDQINNEFYPKKSIDQIPANIEMFWKTVCSNVNKKMSLTQLYEWEAYFANDSTPIFRTILTLSISMTTILVSVGFFDKLPIFSFFRRAYMVVTMNIPPIIFRLAITTIIISTLYSTIQIYKQKQWCRSVIAMSIKIRLTGEEALR